VDCFLLGRSGGWEFRLCGGFGLGPHPGWRDVGLVRKGLAHVSISFFSPFLFINRSGTGSVTETSYSIKFLF
jgi:hypothetical protein